MTGEGFMLTRLCSVPSEETPPGFEARRGKSDARSQVEPVRHLDQKRVRGMDAEEPVEVAG